MTYQGSQRPWRPRWEAIEPHLPSTPGVALDIGAAEGEFSKALADRGWTVHALEYRRPPVQHDGVTWHAKTATARGIARMGPFDLVIAMSVLHHLSDWGAAYWAIRKAGTSFIEVPHPAEERKRSRTLDAKVPALYALAMNGGSVVGEAPGWKCSHLRPTIIHHRGAPAGSPGTVTKGKGIASGKISRMDTRPVLGYDAYPGTLNVEMDKPFTPVGNPGVLRLGRREYQVWPVRIDGIPAHIYRPPNAQGWKRLEIVAPVGLRAVLALKDGARVRIDNPE